MSFTAYSLNPTSYTGVTASNPPNVVIQDRAPIVNDYQNQAIGNIWIVINPLLAMPRQIWMLSSLAGTPQTPIVANWAQLFPSTAGGAQAIGKRFGFL